MMNIKKIIESLVFEKYLPVHGNDINKELELSAEEWEYAVRLSKFLEKRYRKAPVGEILSYFRGTGCSNFYEALHIFYDGRVLPCEFISLKESISCVKEESLSECWNKYRNLRKEWNILPHECNDCKYRNSCHGGCRCMVLLKNNKFSTRDPYCKGHPPFCY